MTDKRCKELLAAGKLVGYNHNNVYYKNAVCIQNMYDELCNELNTLNFILHNVGVFYAHCLWVVFANGAIVKYDLYGYLWIHVTWFMS